MTADSAESEDAGYLVAPADWPGDAGAIRSIRDAVFVRELGIPADLEWDGLDPDCAHLLAYDMAGNPIGTARMQGVRQRPAVFVYDSGQDIPVTVGRYGMPQAMIEEAGGRNIFDDIPSNWPAGNWEDVVQRNPQWIVVIDYGQPDAQGKIDFLLARPELAGVDAIREKRFFVMTYAEATPGPRNIARARALAQALHPDRMPATSHAAN
mgnify:CR=1 FL=1